MLKLELEMVRTWVMTRVAALREEEPDRGSNTSETVIWVALIVVAALVIGGIIVAKITSKANSIDLQ
ncbi:hypothetical protein [Nakamurella endophytica]|uniref:Uncharacterized protein n=1 Tax=Nakamurella endophytica TaxID=1748367 RepID=A0A917T5R4_9ACTN|nr:hypothetical protein [Nakamurella endophytica]GGM10052.1 hypothetical protein GCM10011594_32480 [Nakamurella endophytica]